MGAAKNNPLSPAFRGAISGTIPRLHLEAELVAEVLPSKAWADANREKIEAGEAPVCPVTDLVVQYRIATAALFPSRFTVPAQWKHGQAITSDMGEPDPLPVVMARIIAANPDLKEEWARLVREDVERDGTGGDKSREEIESEAVAETEGLLVKP